MEAYIENNFKSFDPILFYQATSSLISLEKAKASFEEAIDSICNATTKPYDLVCWCKKIKDSNYEILDNDETLIYWANRENKTAKLLKEYTSARNHREIRSNIASSSVQVSGKVTRVSQMKRKITEMKIENDQLCFNGTSVGTKIKNSAEELVKIFCQLNSKKKYVTGMSLNSIIDLSDNTNDSQKQYFNQNEWNSMKEHYKFKTKLTKIRKFDCLDKLNGKLKELNLVDTYASARKLEIKNLESSNEVLFKIYAHIVDMYRFHFEALRFKSNDVTELDSLMKIWGGIFEPLFPDSGRVACKWGESMSEHNQFKIDCRFIFFYNQKLIDLTNMEAARYMTAKKTNDDHLKLAIESKDILDYLVKNSNNFDHTRFCIPIIQICNNQCDVLKLYLADNGLYCVDEFLNLTLPLSPAEFAAQSPQWFQKLFSLRSHVLKLVHLIDDTKRKTYNTHFSRPTNDQEQKINYNTWIRGSFYPPINEDSPLYIPENLYGTSVEQSKKHCTQ